MFLSIEARLIACLTIILSLCRTGSAGVLRVSQNAVGPKHDGLAWQTAFLNLPDAVAAAGDGDDIWVAQGTYADNVTLPLNASLFGGFAGTETVRSQRDPSVHTSGITGWVHVQETVGENTVIDGFVFGSLAHIWLYGASPTVSHNLFQGTIPGVGTAPNYPNTDAQIIGNTFVGQVWGYGVLVGGGSPIVQGNQLYNAYVQYGYPDPQSQPGSPMVVGNIVSCGLEAIDIDADTPYVADNIVYGGEVSVNGSFSTVANNTIVGSSMYGIRFPSVTQGCLIANNVVAFNKYGLAPRIVVKQDIPTVLFNNCVYGSTTADYQARLAESPFGFQGNISVDPQFVNRSGDFHLAATSPLIDAGNDAYVQSGDTDVAGNPRIQGAHVDIGAYEFGGPGFTMGDVAGALRLWGGLSAATPELVARLGWAPAGVDIRGAVRLVRKAAGLEPNP